MLALKVRSQKEKGEEVEVELQRQLGRLKGEVRKFVGFTPFSLF